MSGVCERKDKLMISMYKMCFLLCIYANLVSLIVPYPDTHKYTYSNDHIFLITVFEV